MSNISETETVIKRIVPYLIRRGYDLENDLKFEEPTELDTEKRKGFIDILVTCGKKSPYFLIEAKRDGTKIIAKHRKQAIEYGKSKKCLFVAVTNGKTFEILNTTISRPLKLNGSSFNRLPNKTHLTKNVIPQLKKEPKIENIEIPYDTSLPYRPGLPLSKANHLFKQCHNSIRKIEKDEQYAFTDFSKILFLKLLEEKWDSEFETPPYSYAFHELASYSNDRADQVQTAIKSMIESIKQQTKFGEVLADPIKLKKNATYLTIVKKLSSVSFIDCDLDTKGAAFEYFVRATLKGKKLGQYFTPRPLVKLMLHLGRYQQIVNNLMAGLPFKVLDPACGTGGFLVLAMNLCIAEIENKLKNRDIHLSLANQIIKSLKEDTFYGVDANEGVACSAKMNMIIAGDGHNNIRCEDSLKNIKLVPSYKNKKNERCKDGKAHLILTNPPFGTSEGESLTSRDLGQYELRSTKGQSLFIQKMLSSAHPDSRIVTVIDDGVLNTASYSDLRELILKECQLEYVVSLPNETFKPNKINVKSSVLVLKKRLERDEDLDEDYPVGFIKIESLGYEGSGEEIRGFDLNRLVSEVSSKDPGKLQDDKIYEGYNWKGFKLSASRIIKDRSRRLDIKYWDASTIRKKDKIIKIYGSMVLKEINLIETKRGSSPPSGEYVSESEGYDLVVKAGTNISKKGELITKGDYIDESCFKGRYSGDIILQDGDILLASTGDGTLGKCCVYRNNDKNGNTKPAIADGHVTIIRVDQKKIYPEYLCDYLRKGFGSEQINQLYTGSTGLIEIPPEEVNEIVIPPFLSIAEQKKNSKRLRSIETKTEKTINNSINKLNQVENEFYTRTLRK